MIGIGNNQFMKSNKIGAIPILEDVTNVESKYVTSAGSTFTLPATMNVGDIILATFSTAAVGTNASVSASGWTEYQKWRSANPLTFWWLWHRVDGTEGATVTFSISSSNTYQVQFARISGCKTSGTPFENLLRRSTEGAATVTWSNSNASVGDNRLSLAHSVGYGRFAANITHLTDTSSGYVIADFESYSLSEQFYIWTQSLPTSGSYDGSVTFTTANTLGVHASAFIMLIPLNG